MFELRSAASFPHDKVASLLEGIRAENPEYWSNGLGLRHFAGPRDGLWLMVKEASSDPVGFVGWQHIPQDGEAVGYYSIGVKPEYRRQGLAKQAVAAVISEKRATVDRVVALVAKDNTPSQGLWHSLGGDIHMKLAAGKADFFKTLFKEIAIRGGSGVGMASALDLAANKDKGAIGYMLGKSDSDPYALADFGINTVAGGSMRGMTVPWKAGIGMTSAAKTLATPAVRSMITQNEILRDANNLKAQELGILDMGARTAKGVASGGGTAPGESAVSKWGPYAIAAALLAGGGLAYRGLTQPKKPDPARIRIALPTRNPNDKETVVDMPFNNDLFSNAMRSNLERDIKRRARAEGGSRTKTRSRTLNDVTQVEA